MNTTTLTFNHRAAAAASHLAGNASKAMLWGVLILAALALIFPELAFAQDAKAKIAGAGQKAYDIVFEVVYWLCLIAVIGAGAAAMFGRIEWSKFGQLVLGIVIIFSATAVVDYFR